MKSLNEKTIEALGNWFEGLKLYSGSPAKGTISGALVVLEHLKDEFNLEIDAHTATGGSQVKGASGEAVRRILAEFGETRPFVAEGGRTNRGLRGDIKSMLDAFRSMGLVNLRPEERLSILKNCQKFLVDKVREFHNRQRLKFTYDRNRSARLCIMDILSAARESGREGPVAQYLVGAKLKLRFPEKEIENKSYSTADVQQNRPGDFLLGSSAIHVTVAPMPAVFGKCQRNIQDGLRACLLVPEKLLQGARQNADLNVKGPVEVESIESFVAQNVLEISEFSNELVPKQFLRLLQIYNERVDAVEIDKSMMIEIPQSLLR